MPKFNLLRNRYLLLLCALFLAVCSNANPIRAKDKEEEEKREKISAYRYIGTAGTMAVLEDPATRFQTSYGQGDSLEGFKIEDFGERWIKYSRKGQKELLVKVSPPSYNPDKELQKKPELTLGLEKDLVICGEITDPDGKPATDVEVYYSVNQTIKKEDDEIISSDLSCWTNHYGQFKVRMQTGTLEIEGRKQDLLVPQAFFRILVEDLKRGWTGYVEGPFETSKRVDIKLETMKVHKLKGNVKGADKKPLNAMIIAETKNALGRGLYRDAKTDEAGNFELLFSEPIGQILIFSGSFKRPDYREIRMDGWKESAELNLELQPLKYFNFGGKITDDKGAPLPEAEVWYDYDSGTQNGKSVFASRRIKCDAKGEFKFETSMSIRRVWVVKKGYALTDPKIMEQGPWKEESALSISMAKIKPFTLRGKTVNKKGEGAKEIMVFYSTDRDYDLKSMVQTDKKGNFQIRSDTPILEIKATQDTAFEALESGYWDKDVKDLILELKPVTISSK